VKGAEKADWQSKMRGAPFESESMVYGHIGNGNVVEKALIIRTYEIRGASATLLPDLILKNKHLLNSGTVKIASKELKYTIAIDQGEVEKNEKKLISDKGLVFSDCYFLKAYSGRLPGIFKKSISHILYFEKPGAGRTGVECKNLIQTDGLLSEMGKTLLSDFTVKADACVSKFLGVNNIGKSVAAEPTPEKSTAETPLEGASEIERKLTTLKSLLDKGLIVQDDYDRKKLKLLEDF
jgi:hypothetical protein